MKNIFNDFGKKNLFDNTNIDNTNDDFHASENASNSASNISSNSAPNISSNKSSPEVITSTKKDIGYIFQLNVTRNKLEAIQKKIEKLTDKAQALANSLQEKYGMIAFHQEQVYFAEIEYQKQLSILNQNLKLYNIPDLKILIDSTKRDEFLNKYQRSFFKHTILPIIKAS